MSKELHELTFSLGVSAYIELNKLLKVAGMVASGGEAKMLISQGLVNVNHNKELRIRRKLVEGDIIELMDQKLIIRG